VQTLHNAHTLETLQNALKIEHQNATIKWEKGIDAFGRAFRGAVEAKPESTPPAKQAKRAENNVPNVKAAADRMLLIKRLQVELENQLENK
jgi:hypothetical protein